MLFNVFVTVHVVACFLLIIVVLMQSSKGGGLSGAFGGGGGQTMLGGRETASFLGKATTYLAVIFMVTSLTLAFLSAGRGGAEQESVLRRAAEQQTFGRIVPEEQKNIEDVLGNVPEPAGEETQRDQESGTSQESGTPQESDTPEE
jgi:preprotein translocase subunit SecG